MYRSLFQTGRALALTVFAFTVLLGATAVAQTTLGRLAGSVTDSSGGVLPGATVTLTNQQTNQVQTTVSNSEGTFLFPQVPVGTYKVDIALEGFKTKSYTDLIVNVGQEYSLTAKLDIGTISETVTVEAGSSLIKTTTPEVTSTVLQKQMLDIPLANRDVTNLIKAQGGVQAFINRTNTVINGGRPTWTQVTLDGINIQDNFIRTNSLDFLPNRPNSDNVAEFSITSSVSGADAAGGATSVRMITPSGTNRFTGSVFEFNRDNKYAANSFFNNSTTPSTPKPELSRHQFGGRVGGPIQKNKLFYFANYEGMRQTQQPSQNLVIPANADFYSGVFRYVGTDGVLRSANLMSLTGLTIDPKLRSEFLSLLPDPSKVNNFQVGNSTAERLLNTAGYRFNQTDYNNRDQYTFRVDYTATEAHRFEGVFSYFKETDDRTDLDFISPDRPLVFTSSDPKRYAFGWRWAASSRLQNELRGGANLAPVAFETNWDYAGIGGVLYNTALGITNPVGGFGYQHRFPGAGPIHRYVSAERQRLADDGISPTAVWRQLAAQSRQPLQLCRSVSDRVVRVQQHCASVGPADVSAAARDQHDGSRQRQRDGVLAERHHHLRGADVPGREQDVGLRAGHSVERVLHARQHRAVPPGQLALEAELHRARRPQVGVLQPAQGRRRPRVPAHPQRADVRTGDARPGNDREFRQRPLLREGPEQLRADDWLRLGCDQRRQDRGSRRLLAQLRQRGDHHRRTRHGSRERRPHDDSQPHPAVHDRVGRDASAADTSIPVRADARESGGAESEHAVVGHRSQHHRPLRPPGQRRCPARGRLGDGGRSALCRHFRASDLAWKGFQPAQVQPRVPG